MAKTRTTEDITQAVLARPEVTRLLEHGHGQDAAAVREKVLAYLDELRTTQRYTFYRALQHPLYPILRKVARHHENVEAVHDAVRGNRIVYASLEAPRIDSRDQVSFDILWCPHQDHYRAFECRVQRYLVQGLLDALEETGLARGFQLRFDGTIPAGARTCHFTIWRGSEEEKKAWAEYTRQLEEKALQKSSGQEP
jgi:hypothetical protein